MFLLCLVQTVLVPLLTGLDVGVALVASGVGTLIYILCTKGKVPIYLGSSFAYIGAIAVAVSANLHSSAYFGLMLVGIIYIVVAIILYFTGVDWLKKLLSPVIVGPMIIIIGMVLAPVAIEQSGLLKTGVTSLLNNGMYAGMTGVFWKVPVVAVFTMLVVIVLSMWAKGFFKIIPFILAALAGYALSAILGIVDYSGFASASFFQLPNFSFVGTYSIANLNWLVILAFAPISLVTIAEHIGDHTVVGEIVGEDFIKDPGLHRTLLGDGIATAVAGAMGGPANTSYILCDLI